MVLFPDILALSTPKLTSAISIIRMSGESSIEKVNSCFSKDLTKVRGYQAIYGIIKDNNNQKIDDCVVLVYKEPKSYTGENMVEIFTHGGILVTQLVIDRLYDVGFIQADNGEFTKRAFLNNKLTLLEAESVNDIINSKTIEQLKISQNSSLVNKKLEDIYQEILNIQSRIEVSIEFPEYFEFELEPNIIKDSLLKVTSKINSLIDKSNSTRLLKDGINVCLVGSPNVGKSSIFNNLLKNNKAIVTSIPGTTRDIVEGEITFNGLTINLFDTAGIRKTKNVIEKIGIDKTLETIENSDLVIYVKSPNNKKDNFISSLLLDKKVIEVTNKIDLLENSIDIDFGISTITNQGIDKLLDKIIEVSSFKRQDDYFTYLSSKRTINSLKSVYRYLMNGITNIETNFPVDIINLEISYSLTELGTTLGYIYKEDLLDDIFKNFCIGK